MSDSGYSCAECGVGVIVTPDAVVRGCTHTGTIYAHMEAVVSQSGGASVPDPIVAVKPEPRTLYDLLKNMMGLR